MRPDQSQVEIVDIYNCSLAAAEFVKAWKQLRLRKEREREALSFPSEPSPIDRRDLQGREGSEGREGPRGAPPSRGERSTLHGGLFYSLYHQQIAPEREGGKQRTTCGARSHETRQIPSKIAALVTDSPLSHRCGSTFKRIFRVPRILSSFLWTEQDHFGPSIPALFANFSYTAS